MFIFKRIPLQKAKMSSYVFIYWRNSWRDHFRLTSIYLLFLTLTNKFSTCITHQTLFCCYPTVNLGNKVSASFSDVFTRNHNVNLSYIYTHYFSCYSPAVLGNMVCAWVDWKEKFLVRFAQGLVTFAKEILSLKSWQGKTIVHYVYYLKKSQLLTSTHHFPPRRE